MCTCLYVHREDGREEEEEEKEKEEEEEVEKVKGGDLSNFIL